MVVKQSDGSAETHRMADSSAKKARDSKGSGDHHGADAGREPQWEHVGCTQTSVSRSGP
jgi:hypothetical protein